MRHTLAIKKSARFADKSSNQTCATCFAGVGRPHHPPQPSNRSAWSKWIVNSKPKKLLCWLADQFVFAVYKKNIFVGVKCISKLKTCDWFYKIKWFGSRKRSKKRVCLCVCVAWLAQVDYKQRVSTCVARRVVTTRRSYLCVSCAWHMAIVFCWWKSGNVN